MALTRCYNDPGVLAEMVKCYFDEVVVLLLQMRSALEGNDLLALGRLAHRFKGTVVYIGAEPVSAAVTRVEQFERCGGTKAEAEQALGTLERECEALKAALAEHWVAVCPKDG